MVDAAVDNQARQVFKAARGHEPDEAELYSLRKIWLDNEVLYREGLALQVDKGDPAIRDRVIFKALSMVDAGLKLPPVDDKVLREWFERNRVKYDEPARYDFEEAVLAGDTSEAAIRNFTASLNAGTPETRVPACACSKAARTPTWCRVTAPISSRRSRPLRSGNGAPCPHGTDCT